MPKKIEKRGDGKYRLTAYLGYDSKGKQAIRTKTVTAKNITDAKSKYLLFVQECQQINPENPANFTINDLYAFWQENYSKPNHELTTQLHYQNLYQRVKTMLGSKVVSSIKPVHILNFHKELTQAGLAPNSIQKYHKFLSFLFSKAVQWEFIATNPCKKVDTPKKQTKPMIIYEEDTLQNFLSIVEKEPLKYQLMTYLGLVGGLRREEIFGLEWDRVDWGNQTIRIDQAAPYLPKNTNYLKKPKTESSIRTVSLPDHLMEMLKKQKAVQNLEAKTLENKWIHSNRVFTQWNGSPGHPCSFSTWMKRLVKKHQLPPISPHKLRHFSATYLINLGVDVKTVSGRLGHSRTSTTTDIYSHLLKKSETESAKRIGDFIESIKKKPS